MTKKKQEKGKSGKGKEQGECKRMKMNPFFIMFFSCVM
jgi:hypothetical protein